jgi:hypothetical protein
MKDLDQKCGCRDSKESVSLQQKAPDRGCGCNTTENGIVPTAKNNITEENIAGHYIVGSVQTEAGNIPQISTSLNWRDYLGVVKVRLGFKRDNYKVDPGLYAIGLPDNQAAVFVTANYKLTFDIVRKNLNGLNAWLLVLDTKGINVWCAAGKGTFGTNELVGRIQLTSLDKIVTHRRIYLPQLGATGVAAHMVKESSGFTVIYGPVRITDIKQFIQTGYKATLEMRKVKFELNDRLKLIPNDLIYNLRYLGVILAVMFILSGINTEGLRISLAIRNIIPLTKIIIAGYVSGIVLTPVFLPIIPSQNFAFKGLLMGVIISGLIYLDHSLFNNVFASISGLFLLSSFSSFLAMNFTGSSTFTSLVGVKKEMRIAVPVQIVLASLGIIIVVLKNFL